MPDRNMDRKNKYCEEDEHDLVGTLDLEFVIERLEAQNRQTYQAKVITTYMSQQTQPDCDAQSPAYYVVRYQGLHRLKNGKFFEDRLQQGDNAVG